MHSVSVIAIEKIENNLRVIVDIVDEKGPLVIPGIRDPIADEVARQLGNPLSDLVPILLTDHSILIPLEAIGSRMVLYDLETPEEALEAILREHVVRLAPDLPVLVTKEETIAWIKTKAVAAVDVISDIAKEALMEDERVIILEAAEIRRSSEKKPTVDSEPKP